MYGTCYTRYHFSLSFTPLSSGVVSSVENAVEEMLTKSGMELSERIRLAIETLEENGE